MKIKTLLVLICCVFMFAGCGVITVSALDDVIEDISQETSTPNSSVFIFATDYASGGQIYSASITNNSTTFSNSGMTELGSDAIIKYDNNLLYILHSGYSQISSDNLEIVAPWNETEPFKVIAQYSVGNGTNPQDVVVNGNKAYITLYNPSADPANVDNNGHPADVIVMDTNDGSILNRFSFYDSLNDDGDRNANARKMVLVNNTLYVCLQDLSSDGWFTANSGGKLGKIDTLNNEITGAITLQGWNPADLAVSDDHTKMFVASVDDYSTMSGHGGIEIVNLESQASEALLSDSDLGGYVERLRTNDDTVFAVAARVNWDDGTFESEIVSFPQTIMGLNDVSDFISYGSDIRDIAVDDDFLWVTTRVFSMTEGESSPEIRVYDTTTSDQLGEDLVPTVAGVSIAVVN